MTRYAAGSPMAVPPSFTSSAVIPSGAPIAFTRSRNAGGKLCSRPQSKPIFMSRFLDDVPHDLAQVAGPAVHGKLAVGARPFLENRPHVLHRRPAAEIIDDVVDEVEHLERQVAHRHLGAPAEVDQLPVEAP